MYLGYQNNKIKFYTETPLNMALYNIDRIEETQNEYALEGNEYVIKDSEWEEKQRQKEIEEEKISIKLQLAELDTKRIRAICENEIKDETTGETWLEYYNNQVIDLRRRLNSL